MFTIDLPAQAGGSSPVRRTAPQSSRHPTSSLGKGASARGVLGRLIVLGGFCASGLVLAATPGDAPTLPETGTRIVRVSTESQLQSAMDSLRHGDTVVLADGEYALTRSLYINGRNDVTIRGAMGSTNVVLVGRGMDNPNHGGVPFGVWSNGTNTTLAHLTIRDTYDNTVIFNPGAQRPRLYGVRLLNAGSQFIKSNPTDVSAGLGVNGGVVEHCWLEYTGSPPADHGAGTGYFNGISAHAAKDWVVRGNLFKNLHNPDTAAYLWNPAVLFWRHSTNTVTEQNLFINVDRAIAYGLDHSTPYRDHAGGIIRNNCVYLAPGLMSASRRAGSDGSIIVWNSPGTQVDHNTVLLNGNTAYAIEFRFATTAGAAARNNLADAPIHLRDAAAATQSGNLATAVPGWFLDPANGDLHLLPVATNAIDRVPAPATVTDDFDGEPRPADARADVGADEITARTPPRILDLRVSGAACVIRFTTLAGWSYDLQRAEAVGGVSWSTVVSGLAGTGGVVEALDTDGAGQAHRFYLARRLP